MKGICQKCGQRVSISAEDHPGGRVMLCPDCGLPVRISAHKGPARGNVLLAVIFFLTFLSLGVGIYYTTLRVKATSLEPYVASFPDKIGYGVGMTASLFGIAFAIISIAISIIDRSWSMLALVLNVAMAIAWGIIWYYILWVV